MDAPRAVPLPIRTYLRRFRRPQWEMLLLASVACAAAFGIGQMVMRGRGGLTTEALLAGGALGLAWLAFTEFRETRALVRAGYGHADLMRALRGEREAVRRELWASSDDPMPDPVRVRMMRAVFVAGALGTIASLAGAVLLQPNLAARDALTQMPLRFVVPLAVAVVVALAGGARLILARATLFGDVTIRLWDSRFMRGAFALAGFRVERIAEARNDRPTEVAVGSAVMALLDSLQPTMASELGEIGDLSQRLEDRARNLRAEMAAAPVARARTAAGRCGRGARGIPDRTAAAEGRIARPAGAGTRDCPCAGTGRGGGLGRGATCFVRRGRSRRPPQASRACRRARRSAYE